MEIQTLKAWKTADGYWTVKLRAVGRRAFFSIYHARTLVTSTPDEDQVQRILGDQYGTLREIEVKPGDAA